MTEQNPINFFKDKEYKEICINRDGKKIKVKAKEYDLTLFNQKLDILDDNNLDDDKKNQYIKDFFDKDLVKYLASFKEYIDYKNLTEDVDSGKKKIFNIFLESDIDDEEINDMYISKTTEELTSKPKKCNELKKDNKLYTECMKMSPPYGILVVETKDILPPEQPQPIVEQPIVAQGGTRRRRNNKKNKRKSRNNRKKTNRRR
jgi:hypothetical protein